ncbi:MAG: hypothetical protein HYT07_01815 [Candidatus Levybacteria bacterium]|nr:hypothetical protein [Candidatus Levybacteria bacterium]
MTQERMSQGDTQETLRPRPLTHGEFYLAMVERPDPNGVGLRPEWRSFFVGQERAYKQLTSALTESPAGTVVVLAEHLGTGKDTLIDVVTYDLISQGKTKKQDILYVNSRFHLEENRSFENMVFESFMPWPKPPENWRELKPKILLLKELDYIWGYSKEQTKEDLRRKIAVAGKYLGKEVEILMLVGDKNLLDREIIDVAGSPFEPIYIPLDPLTPDVLKETLRQRFAYVLERSPEEIDVDPMIDPDFLATLIPNTEYPIANMRGTLVIFQEIGRNIKPTEELVRISVELVKKNYAEEFYDIYSRADKETQELLLWLVKHINDHDNGKTMMRAMSPEEIMEACPLDFDSNEIKEEIIHQLIESVGLLEVDPIKGLYLPRQKFFLMAASVPTLSKSQMDALIWKRNQAKREEQERIRRDE